MKSCQFSAFFLLLLKINKIWARQIHDQHRVGATRNDYELNQIHPPAINNGSFAHSLSQPSGVPYQPPMVYPVEQAGDQHTIRPQHAAPETETPYELPPPAYEEVVKK